MNDSLHTLLAHAERQRDSALADVSRADAARRRVHEQCEQFLAYRDEYRQRGPAHGGRSASIEMLRTHQLFMQRLDQALAQLQGQRERAEATEARLRQALVALETRVASVRKLIERRLGTQRLAAAQQDQRRSDDATQQRLWHAREAAAPAGH